MCSVVAKLKRLKRDLKYWNKNVFGDCNLNMEQASQHLQLLQNHISTNGFAEELFDQEVAAYLALDVRLKRRETFLR